MYNHSIQIISYKSSQWRNTYLVYIIWLEYFLLYVTEKSSPSNMRSEAFILSCRVGLL